jgi:hypothetical protein
MATKSHFRIVNESLPNPESTLVLVGTALNGPTHAPFILNDNFPTEDVLGRSPLSKAYNLARKSGLQSVILYRINGIHSTATLTFEGDAPDLPIDVISFRSVAAGDIYNDIEITCGSEKLTITSSAGVAKYYFFMNYPTANAIVEAINLDAEYGLTELTATVLAHGFEMRQFDADHLASFFLEGGSSEANMIPDRGAHGDITATIASLKDRLNLALFGSDVDNQKNFVINSDLGLLDYGVICLVDMFHDDGADFTKTLSSFCQSKSIELNSGAVGVIGVKPIFAEPEQPVSDKAISDKYVSLLGIAPTMLPAGAGQIGIENDTSLSSVYSYVQIVIGDTYIGNEFTMTPEPLSLSYAYAAIQAYLPSQTNMANKGLPGISQLNYEFSKENIDSLLANGYISIVRSIRKGLVPYQAVTGIGRKSNSLLRNPSVVRVSHLVTRRIAEYLDDFIGEATTPVSRSNLGVGLYSLMKGLVENSNIIRDFEVQVDYLNFNTEVRVKVSYVPLSYIESITTVVDMPFNREVIM